MTFSMSHNLLHHAIVLAFVKCPLVDKLKLCPDDTENEINLLVFGHYFIMPNKKFLFCLAV